jgi:hypothetical protein
MDAAGKTSLFFTPPPYDCAWAPLPWARSSFLTGLLYCEHNPMRSFATNSWIARPAHVYVSPTVVRFDHHEHVRMSQDSPNQTSSGRDVFISYASQDAAVAHAIVESLEAQGLKCWIAPRDVKPGAQYADAIVRAINEAKPE